MSDMKCPFCGGELSKRQAGTTDYANMFTVYLCDNVNCDETTDLVGCKEFWDILGQLIRTKKQLEIAVDALKVLKPEKATDSIIYKGGDNE